MRIYIIGFPGSGKSTFGRQLAEYLGMPFIDLDCKIVAQEKMSINEIFKREGGESYFRKVEKEILESSIANSRKFVMATGGGTPCFHNNINIMNTTGITIFLDVAKPILFERLLQESTHRPLINSLSPLGIKEYINKTLNKRLTFYVQCTFKVQPHEYSLNQLPILLRSIHKINI